MARYRAPCHRSGSQVATVAHLLQKRPCHNDHPGRAVPDLVVLRLRQLHQQSSDLPTTLRARTVLPRRREFKKSQAFDANTFSSFRFPVSSTSLGVGALSNRSVLRAPFVCFMRTRGLDIWRTPSEDTSSDQPPGHTQSGHGPLSPVMEQRRPPPTHTTNFVQQSAVCGRP